MDQNTINNAAQRTNEISKYRDMKMSDISENRERERENERGGEGGRDLTSFPLSAFVLPKSLRARALSQVSGRYRFQYTRAPLCELAFNLKFQFAQATSPPSFQPNR